MTDELINDLCAVADKHARTLDAQQWHDACMTAMRAFFSADACLRVVSASRDATERCIAAMRKELQSEPVDSPTP